MSGLWFNILIELISSMAAVCHVRKACVARPWRALKWPGTGNMTVCIYRPFRAFHWPSHSLTRENTSCYTANSLRVPYTSATESSLCVLQCVCERTDARRPKIECTPNYCCKHRCGKPGLPPPKSPDPPSSTQQPVCSCLGAQEVEHIGVCKCGKKVCTCVSSSTWVVHRVCVRVWLNE